MPPVETKVQLISKLKENRNKLEKLITRLSPQEMERPGVCGIWSVKDILAHLDDWQQRNIEWIDAAYRGQYLEVPAPGFSWRAEDVDRLNNQIYEAHCQEPLEDVLIRFRSTFERFVAQLESISEEDLFSPGVVPFVGKNGNLAKWYIHYAWHDGWGRNQIYTALVKNSRSK